MAATLEVLDSPADYRPILKVKGWANEVGGLKQLKALVDALGQ